MKNPRIVFEWQRSHSEASKAAWKTRWKRGDAVGPKGKAYLEHKYGPVEVPADIYEDYADYWDFEIEY